ncbi:hypothetical protein [Lactococcus ileimucosae]|uniref:hypothetical protein n=1 Tax=Lactococcus ileimucosae TaxID=2941329 RepID=UPI0020443FFD|nr:hypothetical protein [Lactococcus ileimucosae]
MKKSILISVGILTAIALTIVLSIGGKKYMDARTHEKNLENQRQAALALKKKEPHVTKVEFISEGSYPGVGIPWTVGAEVTMGGEIYNMSLEAEGDYSINLGKDENNYKSDKLEEIKSRKAVEHHLEVIYSNGETEVIE